MGVPVIDDVEVSFQDDNGGAQAGGQVEQRLGGRDVCREAEIALFEGHETEEVGGQRVAGGAPGKRDCAGGGGHDDAAGQQRWRASRWRVGGGEGGYIAPVTRAARGPDHGQREGQMKGPACTSAEAG